MKRIKFIVINCFENKMNKRLTVVFHLATHSVFVTLYCICQHITRNENLLEEYIKQNNWHYSTGTIVILHF